MDKCPKCLLGRLVDGTARVGYRYQYCINLCGFSQMIENSPKLFSVVAALFQDGKILAVSRRNNKDDLGLVGGKVDPGETPDQAIVREVKEETGLTIEKFDLVFVRGEETASGRLSGTYLVSQWSGELSSPEGLWVGWVPPERLLEENCSFHKYNRAFYQSLSQNFIELLSAANGFLKIKG